MTLLARGFVHPNVWYGPAMAARTDWIVQLDADDLADLDRALRTALSNEAGIPGMRCEDFPLTCMATKLHDALDTLERGRGFLVLRGLPVERYTKKEIALMYWGMGTYLGRAVAQNAQGELLGHIRNLGVDWKNDNRARGYQTRDRLPFHVDSTDVVGLCCLRKARRGGSSRIVSSTAIHNEILRTRPDCWKVLCEPFYADRRSEEGPGRDPFFVTPCFNERDGRLFVYFSFLIQSAQRLAQVPRLTELQREALDLVVQLANDPALYLDMDLEPGDVQFLCNYGALHSRTEYEDWPEPDRKRHLLRLWLYTPGFAGKLPASYAGRASDIELWQRNPVAPIFDNGEIVAELTD